MNIFVVMSMSQGTLGVRRAGSHSQVQTVNCVWFI